MVNRAAVRRATVLAATIAVGAGLGMPTAQAESVSGWIGPTPAVNGQTYLHYSTISNSPLFADTRMYTAFGNAVPAYYMGVRSRLFKSGALCAITPYKYNTTQASSITGPTTGDCGPGSYNSHGFVVAKGTSGYQEYVTFPSNPLDFAGSTARVAEAEPRSTADGLTIGSGEQAQSDSELPDLVASYGTNGELGYIRSADIPAAPSTTEEIQALPTVTDSDGTVYAQAPGVTIPLYAEDNVTVIGEFQIG